MNAYIRDIALHAVILHYLSRYCIKLHHSALRQISPRYIHKRAQIRSNAQGRTCMLEVPVRMRKYIRWTLYKQSCHASISTFERTLNHTLHVIRSHPASSGSAIHAASMEAKQKLYTIDTNTYVH